MNPNTFLGSFTEVGTSRIQNLKQKAKQGLGGQIRGLGSNGGQGSELERLSIEPLVGAAIVRSRCQCI